VSIGTYNRRVKFRPKIANRLEKNVKNFRGDFFGLTLYTHSLSVICHFVHPQTALAN